MMSSGSVQSAQSARALLRGRAARWWVAVVTTVALVVLGSAAQAAATAPTDGRAAVPAAPAGIATTTADAFDSGPAREALVRILGDARAGQVTLRAIGKGAG